MSGDEWVPRTEEHLQAEPEGQQGNRITIAAGERLVFYGPIYGQGKTYAAQAYLDALEWDEDPHLALTASLIKPNEDEDAFADEELSQLELARILWGSEAVDAVVAPALRLLWGE